MTLRIPGWVLNANLQRHSEGQQWRRKGPQLWIPVEDASIMDFKAFLVAIECHFSYSADLLQKYLILVPLNGTKQIPTPLCLCKKVMLQNSFSFPENITAGACRQIYEIYERSLSNFHEHLRKSDSRCHFNMTESGSLQGTYGEGATASFHTLFSSAIRLLLLA